MKFFLFPKEFSIPNVENTLSFILRDDNNIRLSIPVKFSTYVEDLHTNCENTVISESDLKVLTKEIFNALSIKNEIHSESISTINDFFIKQYKELGEFYDVKNFPTVTECLQSKDLIMKTDQDLTKLETVRQINEFKPSKILFNDTFVLDLYYVKQFTTEFKKFRQYLGMTQKEVCQSMSYHLKSDFSQTTVCRFESMSLAITNMFELIPYFRKWISKVYNPDKTITAHNVSKIEHESNHSSTENEFHLSSTENESLKDERESNIESKVNKLLNKRNKNRKKRIIFTDHQVNRMEQLFQTVKHSQITYLVYKKYAKELKITDKQIRCWFAKRRKNDRLSKIRKK